MTHTVVVAAPAERQILVIDDWWRCNRPAAPLLFAEGFAACAERLRSTMNRRPMIHLARWSRSVNTPSSARRFCIE